MACRSIKRAEIARLEILKFLDARVAYLKAQQHYDGHAEKFRQNVEIVCLRLDLADISTVFRFADEVTSRYFHVYPAFVKISTFFSLSSDTPTFPI